MSEKQDVENVKKIKEWLGKQPHLPQKVDEILLERFLHCCDYSLEKTKSFIDLFFTVRSQAPEIFSNRDPLDPDLLAAMENFQMVPLPMKTDENYQLLFYRFTSNNADKYHYINTIKVLFMLADIRILYQTEIPEGEVPIFDMDNFTLKHLTKVNLSVMKKYMFYSQEAHPIKLKQIHLLSIPSYLDKCLAVAKPFLKSEVSKMIYFHQANSTTLNEFIKQDLLPEEYGGKSCTCKEMQANWIQKIKDHREYFLDEERWKVDETKRPNNNNCNGNVFGMQGSFKTLSID